MNRDTIVVAAGTNGAGKSTIVQPFIEAAGGNYFNPDLYARALVQGGVSIGDANAQAWTRGFEQLRDSVEFGGGYAFETTLGGHSIAFELMRGLAFQRRVMILYVGLASADLHLRRVRERVARGGHDIPPEKIRQRYDDSRKNLLAFIGTAASIRVWDNSAEDDQRRAVRARELFRIENRRLSQPAGADASETPGWARPLLAQALKLGLGAGSRRH